MANKNEEPPPYGGAPAPPVAPKPAYGGPSGPYQGDDQRGHQSYYQPQQQQQGYYQPGPPMGYYNQQQQGPYPAGQGPYPPTGQYGQYGPGPGPGYAPQQRSSPAGGIMTGLLAGLACCCCLDCLF